MKFQTSVKLLLLSLLLFLFVLDVTGNVAQTKFANTKTKKRNVHTHKHRDKAVEINAESKAPEIVEAEEQEVISLAPPTDPPAKTTKAPPTKKALSGGRNPNVDLLEGLYPDVRSCYEGIPRKFEKFAQDRMEKRESLCSKVYTNTTSVCYKQCILLNLGYIMTYTVTVMGTSQRQRRYKIHQKSECGHNSFGQDLLGIDTKVWDDRRAERQKREKDLYFRKVNELGIRGYDPDPFHMKFATSYGEDITDERLEAQMHICKLFDISVDDIQCTELSPQDEHKLSELVNCLETALSC